MLTVLSFLVAINILVTFHEFGHFIVARWCGVRVLRFSIGFGRPLVRYYWKATEWVLCPILLGGYVKMLNRCDTDPSTDEQAMAFDQQSVLKRVVIVVAGPMANLLLAALLYWLVLMQGVTQLHPLIGTVIPATPAAAAGFKPGDRILTVNEQAVDNWQAVHRVLMDTDPVQVKIKIVTTTGREDELNVDVGRFGAQAVEAMQQGNLGWAPWRYLPVLGFIEQGSVAEQAGLQIGDRLLALNGKRLTRWEEWIDAIRTRPGEMVTLLVQRGQEQLTLKVQLEARQQKTGEIAGRLGFEPTLDETWQQQLSYVQHYGLAEALVQGVAMTWDTAWMSIRFIWWMVTGRSSLDNLSGPLTIASATAEAARAGLTAYLEMLAVISISIGVLNLLPIPVLDGGHLMYYGVELLRGKLVSERTQLLGQKFGLLFIMSLMAFALLNDFSRLLGG